MVVIGLTGVTVATTPGAALTPDQDLVAVAVAPDRHPHLLIGILVAIAGLALGVAVLTLAVRAERRADAAERTPLTN
jgi:hypothetical protein